MWCVYMKSVAKSVENAYLAALRGICTFLRSCVSRCCSASPGYIARIAMEENGASSTQEASYVMRVTRLARLMGALVDGRVTVCRGSNIERVCSGESFVPVPLSEVDLTGHPVCRDAQLYMVSPGNLATLGAWIAHRVLLPPIDRSKQYGSAQSCRYAHTYALVNASRAVPPRALADAAHELLARIEHEARGSISRSSVTARVSIPATVLARVQALGIPVPEAARLALLHAYATPLPNPPTNIATDTETSQTYVILPYPLRYVAKQLEDMYSTSSYRNIIAMILGRYASLLNT